MFKPITSTNDLIKTFLNSDPTQEQTRLQELAEHLWPKYSRITNLKRE
jgi:hypothetical protein